MTNTSSPNFKKTTLVVLSILVASVAILSPLLVYRLPTASFTQFKQLLSSRQLPLLKPATALFQRRTTFTATTTSLKMSYDGPYAKERRIAELAVQRASLLTQKVYHSKVKGTVSKDDRSPVTIADYGAQALIISALQHVFPDDVIVGEEEAGKLRENEELRNTIWDLVKETSSGDEGSELGSVKDAEEMMTMIDKGCHNGGIKGRMWALDPVDGTLGFLRGEQYAIALGLIVDGEIQLGVLGCPNLYVDVNKKDASDAKGILMSAVKGQKAYMRSLTSDKSLSSSVTPVSMSGLTDLREASMCESVESKHSAHDTQAAICSKLGITKPSVRMDSQAKYASIARADGDVYLRLPVSDKYEEKIWDHVAGCIIVEEAGGTVTDMWGNKLDFTQGRTLKKNKGIVATGKEAHPQVLKAVKEVMESNAKGSL